MLTRIRIALEWLDARPDWVFLLINAGIASFIALAHGGALALTHFGKAPMFEEYVPILIASVTLATLLLVSAIVAITIRRIRRPVLSAHAILLSLVAVSTLGIALFWVVAGLPEGGFSWTPGFITFLSAYPAFLVWRAIGARLQPEHSFLSLLPFWVAVIAFTLDCGIGVRFGLAFAKSFSRHS